MNRLSKYHFWDWFARHHQEYLELPKKNKKETTYWLSEMNTHLRAYSRFIGYNLEWQKRQKAILTITVSGKPKHFKKVDDLVSKAPEIPGWTFLALEPPRPVDFLLDKLMQETGVDPREFRFSYTDEKQDSKTLAIYHPLYNPENEIQLYELAYEAAYNLLGERSFGTDIDYLKVDNLSYAREDTQELETLPDYIGQHKSVILVDSKGNLLNMK